MKKNMHNIGKKIKEIRLTKGFSQEELAERSQLNLRTIQRIEKQETEPRGKTLHLLCKALQLNLDDMQTILNQKTKKTLGASALNLIYLVLLNLFFITIINFMTLDVEATLNSRVGGFLLSFCVPFIVVYFTQNLKSTERVLKFGGGYIFDIILLFIIQGWHEGMKAGIQTGLFLCLIVSIGTLFYGDSLMRKELSE
jgi:transcriptional regulator with XRE-family HTH domain